MQPQSSGSAYQVQPLKGSVPGLQQQSSAANLIPKEEKEDNGNTKASPGMLSGSIKDEDLVSIYSGADATQVPHPPAKTAATSVISAVLH